jgi:hypothetical protein
LPIANGDLWWIAVVRTLHYQAGMDEPTAGLSKCEANVSRGHMDQHRQNDWGSVQYDSRFEEYWIHAGSAQQCLFYCPWCGEKLPASKRDEWFDAVESLGLNPLRDEVPEEFRSDVWREATKPIT